MTAKRSAPLSFIVRSGLAALAAAGALFAYSNAWAGTVQLNWTAPGDDSLTGRATTYDLRYSLTPISGTVTLAWWNAATPVASMPQPRTAGSRESFTVTGVDSGTTYYFVIRTADEVPNWSGFSNIVAKVGIGTTSYTLDTPQQFRAQVTQSAVTLTWVAVPSSAGTEYHLYRTGPGDTSPQLVGVLPLATTSWTDSAVTSGATYQYRLATSGGGLEGTPAVTQATVPGSAPPEATVVKAYPNPTRGQATLLFTVAGNAAARSRITLFDLTGHRIRELVNAVLAPGPQTLVWDGHSSRGEKVAPGLYNVIFDLPSGRQIAQLVVLP